MAGTTSKFSTAKREARTLFRELAQRGFSVCADAASYSRSLDDAALNARNYYLGHKNPDWDHTWPDADMESGALSLEPREIDLLSQKQEYERNLKNLDAHFPALKQHWSERYAREAGRNCRTSETAVSQTESRSRAFAASDHEPLGENPFPPEHSAYDVFKEATWKAKHRIGAFKSRLLNAKFDSNRGFLDSAALYRLEWFTACAFEATLIVGNEETAKWYEHWIDDLAAFVIDDTVAGLKRKNPRAEPDHEHPFSSEDLNKVESHLTIELMKMCAHYKTVTASRAIEVLKLKSAEKSAKNTIIEATGAYPITSTINAVGVNYQAWFQTNLKTLEEMVGRHNPLHLPLDEQDAVRFSITAVTHKFDEEAGATYRNFLENSLSCYAFESALSELRLQVLTESAAMWKTGSEALWEWYEKKFHPYAEGALNGKVTRWEHRARTADILRHLSRGGSAVLSEVIEVLEGLKIEEIREVPGSEDRRRLKVWVHGTSHHFEGGYGGDFLERVRLVVKRLGRELSPPTDVSPADHCLWLLLCELICEREPLNNPHIHRLNNDQLGRYVWASTSGRSNTEESGQILNVCEALKWYCARLAGLLDSPEAVANQTEPVQSPVRQTMVTPKSGYKGGDKRVESHGGSDFEFGTDVRREQAIERYIKNWTTDSQTCSEASLARTSTVHPADLSRWKKGLLPTGSDKKQRIENSLRNNAPPIFAIRPDPDA